MKICRLTCDLAVGRSQSQLHIRLNKNVLVENSPNLHPGSDSKDDIWCYMVYWQAHITLNDWNNLLRLGGMRKGKENAI